MSTNVLNLADLGTVSRVGGGRKPDARWETVKQLAPGQAIASWSKSAKSMQHQVYQMKKGGQIPQDIRTGIRTVEGVPTVVIYRPEAVTLPEGKTEQS